MDLDAILSAIGGAAVAFALAAALLRKLVAHQFKKATIELEAAVARNVRLIALKLPVYKKLWELSGAVQSSHPDALTYSRLERDDIRRSLLDWYYSKGAGALLSFQTQRHFRAAIELLGADGNEAILRKVFSGLRTQMKEDLGIYKTEEADSRLNTKPIIDAATQEVGPGSRKAEQAGGEPLPR